MLALLFNLIVLYWDLQRRIPAGVGDTSTRDTNKRAHVARNNVAKGDATSGANVRGGTDGGVFHSGGGGGGGDESDERTSSILMWPGRLETGGEAARQASVPYRLTCLRVTAFGARFKGARNVLLAGTREGIVLAFDWGRLLRDSGGGSTGDGKGSGVVRRERENDTLSPSIQVHKRVVQCSHWSGRTVMRVPFA